MRPSAEIFCQRQEISPDDARSFVDRRQIFFKPQARESRR